MRYFVRYYLGDGFEYELIGVDKEKIQSDIPNNLLIENKYSVIILIEKNNKIYYKTIGGEELREFRRIDKVLGFEEYKIKERLESRKLKLSKI